MKIPSEIDENAWVVSNLDDAIKFWLTLGYGPFFTTNLDLEEVQYRGQKRPLNLKIAIARAGDVHIELIEQINDGPSAYRDVFPKGTSGFHHIRKKAGITGNEQHSYDDLISEFSRNGIDVVMEMQFGEQRVAYVDTRLTLGCMLEIYDPSEAIESLKRFTLEASLGWDGINPVRSLDLSTL